MTLIVFICEPGDSYVTTVKLGSRLRAKAQALKQEVITLSFAMRHPRTPWQAKLLGGLVVAYALSPIDLIPDFIPVIGLLDDLVIVPLGIALTLRMIPPDVLEESRARARAAGTKRPRSLAGAAIVISAWLLTAAMFSMLVWRLAAYRR